MAENRLAKETSTYLRGAAQQPVQWHPWGEDAFRRAKELDRPILLDIGATWCHWCHVIDRESYEDPELAGVINDNFVAIKVDRDERPDIDARYQQAVGAIAGQGGWPLTAFLTPDGKVFHGGTYFPPKDSYGRPSFRRVLLAMADAYRTNKADTLKEAEALHQALAEGRVALIEEGAVNEAMLKESLDSLRGQFDPVNGGISGQQMSPHTGTMKWDKARFHRTKEEGLRKIFTRTLMAMAQGGVYDQVGGGFHRYSTDPRWIVPHFEKMLYDNAGLLANYVHACQLTRDPLYRQTAEAILAWGAQVDSSLMEGNDHRRCPGGLCGLWLGGRPRVRAQIRGTGARGDVVERLRDVARLRRWRPESPRPVGRPCVRRRRRARRVHRDRRAGVPSHRGGDHGLHTEPLLGQSGRVRRHRDGPARGRGSDPARSPSSPRRGFAVCGSERGGRAMFGAAPCAHRERRLSVAP